MAELLWTKAGEWRPVPAVAVREEPWWVKPTPRPSAKPAGRPVPRDSGAGWKPVRSRGEGEVWNFLRPRGRQAGRECAAAVPGGRGGLTSGFSDLIRSGGPADVRRSQESPATRPGPITHTRLSLSCDLGAEPLTVESWAG